MHSKASATLSSNSVKLVWLPRRIVCGDLWSLLLRVFVAERNVVGDDPTLRSSLRLEMFVALSCRPAFSNLIYLTSFLPRRTTNKSIHLSRHSFLLSLLAHRSDLIQPQSCYAPVKRPRPTERMRNTTTIC